mmetsp:Transcript_24857/g.42293  ORF Transcript_24857/g.42293 Transcript_24857/m.42293 type:complete len:85 (-) Transcript_24857:128-382(-)
MNDTALAHRSTCDLIVGVGTPRFELEEVTFVSSDVAMQMLPAEAVNTSTQLLFSLSLDRQIGGFTPPIIGSVLYRWDGIARIKE